MEKTTDNKAIDHRRQSTRPRRKPHGKQPGTGNGQLQHLTDNRQQTAYDMQENARTCEMPHFVCGEQRAAGSGQPAACAKHFVRDNQCVTRHRRHTRCNIRPYDPCRSMHQTQTEPTTRSRQCTVRNETNEIWKLAHLGARCAGGGGVGWSVGLGLPESDVTVESCNSQNWAFGYGGTDCAKSDVPNPQAKTRRSTFAR